MILVIFGLGFISSIYPNLFGIKGSVVAVVVMLEMETAYILKLNAI
jgi:hypothetical protein